MDIGLVGALTSIATYAIVAILSYKLGRANGYEDGQNSKIAPLLEAMLEGETESEDPQ